MTVRLETPSTRDQFEQWAMIMELVEGDDYEVDELAHVIQDDADSAWVLASRGDEALGCGVGRPSSIAGSLYAMARVLPEHRGQASGRSSTKPCLSMRRRLASRRSGAGSKRGTPHRCASPRAGAYVRSGREHEVVLEAAEADLAGNSPDGVELVSLAERPDLVRPVYEVDVEVGPDVPSHEEGHEPMSFERWHATYLEGPGAMPAACIVALAGGETVGYTGLRRHGSASPIADNLLTAVRRPWRRRGIALALRREQIRRARDAGVERIYTTNDESNVGTRGVNARLG